MFRLFVKTILEKKTHFLYYSLGAFLLVWMYIAIFPSLKPQIQNYAKLAESFPPAMLKAFNISFQDMATITGYLNTEHFSFVWPLLLIFFTISLAGSLIAGEIENRTMGLLLSAPISRLKIFVAKYLAIIIGLAIFILLSILTIPPLASAYNESINLNHVLTLAGLCFLFGLALAGISIFFSAILSNKSRVNGLVGAVLVLMYVLNLIAALKDSLSDLKYLSFFYYFNSSQALSSGIIDTTAIWVFALTALIFSLLGLVIFLKRDITI